MGWFMRSKASADDPEVRLSAVQGMTDQSRLVEMARLDPDARVRDLPVGAQ